MLFSFDIKYRFFSFLVQFIESVVTVFRNDPLLSEIFDVIRNILIRNRKCVLLKKGTVARYEIHTNTSIHRTRIDQIRRLLINPLFANRFKVSVLSIFKRDFFNKRIMHSFLISFCFIDVLRLKKFKYIFIPFIRYFVALPPVLILTLHILKIQYSTPFTFKCRRRLNIPNIIVFIHNTCMYIAIFRITRNR